jgi:hypothetical protein
LRLFDYNHAEYARVALRRARSNHKIQSRSFSVRAEFAAKENHMPQDTPLTPELKGALKAFKKRMKVMKLDSESGKITGPLSSGRTSGIVAITPPAQFPREIWDELVKLGKLEYDGNGLFKLIE